MNIINNIVLIGITTFCYNNKKNICNVINQTTNCIKLCFNMCFFDIKNLVTIKKQLVKSGFYGIKLIQWIVNRAEIYLDNRTEVLLQLKDIYDNCEQHPISYTKTIFKKDFNYDFDTLIK